MFSWRQFASNSLYFLFVVNNFYFQPPPLLLPAQSLSGWSSRINIEIVRPYFQPDVLAEGWWFEKHRVPKGPCMPGGGIVVVGRESRPTKWYDWLRPVLVYWRIGDWHGLAYYLLVIAGLGLIWVWQRAVMYLAKPTKTSLCQSYGWQSELVRAKNIITIEFLVMVTIRPIEEGVVSSEADPLFLLQSGQEEEEVGLSVSNDNPERVVLSQPAESIKEGPPQAETTLSDILTSGYALSIILMAVVQVKQAQERTVPTRQRKNRTEKKPASNRGRQRICLPIDPESYQGIVTDRQAFRQWLEQEIVQHPELFPVTIQAGYILDGFLPASKKMPEIRLRRIKLKEKGSSQCGVYTITPSFVLSYRRGYTDEVEPALFLRRFGVPYWALTRLFGRNDMYWFRLEHSLGRNSIVGTTVKGADKLPADTLADEKHTYLNGQKAFIATTVAKWCVLGAQASLVANTVGLTEAYHSFKAEAQNIDPAYTPQTVNIDGWTATEKAWLTLFPTVTPILCFLHSFIKIRSCSKSQAHFPELSTRVWELYHSPDKVTFKQNIKLLKQWASDTLPPGPTFDAVQKLCSRQDEFLKAYDFPSAFRTSNTLDRHMQLMDRFLFSTKYFHGHFSSMSDGVRAWALLHNFQPYCPRSKAATDNFLSPAHKLNGFVYHPCWLQNLLVSASMAGYRTQPKKKVE